MAMVVSPARKLEQAWRREEDRVDWPKRREVPVVASLVGSAADTCTADIL